jgi:uncharacterized membrane protein
MITVTLYSRADCHLCEQTQQELAALQSEIPHKLVVIDVDSHPDLQRAYGFDVPVVEVGPYKLRAPINPQELRITLMAAQDRKEQLESLGDPEYQRLVMQGQTWTKADGFAYWLSKHYLAVFNIIVLVYLGLPVLAPVLMKARLDTPARLIYRVYGTMCHQWSFRSFFLFGEQAVYPRAAAGVKGLLTFSQATGLGEGSTANDLIAAREFVGNDTVGYKMALCERDIAIWAGILLFGVVYALSGRRLPPLPWYLWIIIGMVPIGLDGFSQLLSQPPLSLYAFRESTPFLRVLTGALFGVTTAWFGYPMTEQAMADTRRIMASKLLRIKAGTPTQTPATG